MKTAISYLAVPLMALCGAAAAQQASGTSAGQGLSVVRDADTGKPRAPTPAEMQALLDQPAAVARGQPAPLAVTGRHGETSVHLGERQLVYTVVRRDANGKLDRQCAGGSDAAQRMIGPAAPAAPHGDAAHEHR